MKRCDHLLLLDANPGKILVLHDMPRTFRAAASDVAAGSRRQIRQLSGRHKIWQLMCRQDNHRSELKWIQLQCVAPISLKGLIALTAKSGHKIQTN